ncbi:uncharacterized protein LOC117282949 isoform X3 [Cryptotermes secundus]|uniref:uncharacterized protein LOC117282949 isoform X3 n=1 Tax=Cryptotermes secundus TaxID=105785 RepID=UPI001454D132|nr:uncharacterized protein LOC117282949 isoform X3 [Cryptotermes secundus]
MRCVIAWKVACESARHYRLFNRRVVYNGKRHKQEADGNRQWRAGSPVARCDTGTMLASVACRYIVDRWSRFEQTPATYCPGPSQSPMQ